MHTLISHKQVDSAGQQDMLIGKGDLYKEGTSMDQKQLTSVQNPDLLYMSQAIPEEALLARNGSSLGVPHGFISLTNALE